jgi:RNA polymerase sigma-70 factor (ECF subfamily)
MLALDVGGLAGRLAGRALDRYYWAVMSPANSENPTEPAIGSFASTRWSLIAATKRPDSPDAAAALNELCQMYWYPLYCYARRRDHAAADAEDLIQGFFCELLQNGLFTRADPAKGKLRALLLSSLQNFMADQRKRAGAAKRGGQIAFVPFDTSDAELRYASEPADLESPDRLYERRWAFALIDRATAVLGEAWAAKGKRPLFDALSGHLLARLDSADAQKIASLFGMTENHLKVSLHRLRERFGDLLRREIAATVDSEAEVEEELAFIRALFA